MAKESRKQCVKKRSPGSLSGVAFLSRTPSKTPTQLTALYRPSDARKSTRTASASGARSRPGGALSPSVKLKVLGNSSGRSTLVPEWPLNSGRPSRLSYSNAKPDGDSKPVFKHRGSTAPLERRVIDKTKARKRDATDRLPSVDEVKPEDLSNAIDTKSSQTAIERSVVLEPGLDSGLQSLSTSSSTIAQSSVMLAWSDEANLQSLRIPSVSEPSLDMPTTTPVSSDSEYDTDIEEDFKKTKEPYDASARDVYETECKKLSLTPAKFMCRHMGETSVTMRHHSLGADGGRCLAKAIARNAFIEHLDLTDNYLESEGGVAFASMLLENSIIKELDLSENFLRSRGGTAFAQALKVNESLKRLSLRSNHLMDMDAKIFAEMMKINITLEKLDLSYNSFGAHGGIYLGGGLSVNCTLKVLDLRYNCITLRGGVALATALKTNDTLEVLNLSGNGYALLGCMAFANSLRVNRTLLELDLSNNRIHDEGAKYLAKGLAKNEGLQVFKVGKNPIGMAGVEELIRSVKSNQSLRLVALEELKVSAKAMEQIRELNRLRGLMVEHGRMSFYEKEVEPEMGIDLVVKFIQEHRYRLIDLFFRLDKDRSGEVTCREFKRGLKETGLGMSDEQLTDMINMLDLDSNGRINYSELCSGKQDVIQERRRRVKLVQKKTLLDRQRMRLPTAYFKFDVTGK